MVLVLIDIYDGLLVCVGSAERDRLAGHPALLHLLRRGRAAGHHPDRTGGEGAAPGPGDEDPAGVQGKAG